MRKNLRVKAFHVNNVRTALNGYADKLCAVDKSAFRANYNFVLWLQIQAIFPPPLLPIPQNGIKWCNPGLGSVNFFMAQDMDRWRALVNSVLNLRVP
jgi:hypothetical protein